MGVASSMNHHRSRIDPFGMISSEEEEAFLNAVKIARFEGRNDFTQLEEMLTEDPSIIIAEGNGWNALHVACASSDPRNYHGTGSGAAVTVELIQYLIQKGANLKARNSAGHIPLSLATDCHLPDEIIELMVREGSDPNAIANNGVSATESLSAVKKQKLKKLYAAFCTSGPQIRPRAYGEYSNPEPGAIAVPSSVSTGGDKDRDISKPSTMTEDIKTVEKKSKTRARDSAEAGTETGSKKRQVVEKTKKEEESEEVEEEEVVEEE